MHTSATPRDLSSDRTDIQNLADSPVVGPTQAELHDVPEKPYAFHPENSTGNPRGNTWSAHTYTVAMSDEIGHFENCLALDAQFDCSQAGAQDPTLDADDSGCVPGTDSLLVHINGCFSPDSDYDGQSYRLDWPGTNPNVALDRALHPSAVRFTSPLTRGRNYPTIAFETDLPRIEASDSQANPPFCDRTTGANCVNPSPGARFYLLLRDERFRRLRLARRRQVPARDHERLRRQFHD
jgi:hypothetical protein